MQLHASQTQQLIANTSVTSHCFIRIDNLQGISVHVYRVVHARTPKHCYETRIYLRNRVWRAYDCSCKQPDCVHLRSLLAMKSSRPCEIADTEWDSVFGGGEVVKQ